VTPKPKCVCGCGRRSANLHHAVYAQEVKRHGGNLKDRRNLVPMAFDCHGAHHGGSKRLQLHMLPDPVFEFAAELMGAGAAYEYLRRYYDGSDMRLEFLLAEA
jgi:hypothetical protein